MNAVSIHISKGIMLILAVLFLASNLTVAQDCNTDGEALFKRIVQHVTT